MAGSGSLEKRGDKTWRLIASCGMKGDKQIKKKKTVTVKVACEQKSCQGCARTERCLARREAKKLLAEFVMEIEKGTFIDPAKLTFQDFTERWLKDYAEGNLAPKTIYRYKEILNSRILPAMGHLKIDQIKPTHLLEFYANLQEDGIRMDGKPGGLSGKTVLYHHRVISAILSDAVEWQVLTSNPASRVKPPKVKKNQAGCYDEEQTVVLIDALEKEELKYKVIITLALFTGLRRGELMGLEWQDIDFNRGIMEVRQVSQYIPGQGTFTKEPKNETSKRIMAIPASVLNLLKQHKAHQAAERLKAGSLWRGSGVLSDFTEVFNAVTPKEISGAQLLKSLTKQKTVSEKWEENLQTIADKVNNEEFIQELRKFGEKAASEIAALNTLTDEQLKEYISLYQEKRKSWRGGRLFTTWDGRPMHPDTLSSWFPKFIKTYNTREAFNAEISAVSNKLSAQDLENLEGLREKYIKLNRTNFKTAKEKLTAVEDSITAIIGQEGLRRIQQGQTLPPLPFHGLRHTAATMLINQGLPAKSISGRLGHADIGTTYNIYGHYLKSADKEAADSLERVYQNMTGNGKNDTTKEQA